MTQDEQKAKTQYLAQVAEARTNRLSKDSSHSNMYPPGAKWDVPIERSTQNNQGRGSST